MEACPPHFGFGERGGGHHLTSESALNPISYPEYFSPGLCIALSQRSLRYGQSEN